MIVFTDLDGTLLDERGEFGPAREALERLRALGVPVVPVTAKTRKEVEALGLEPPFIVENGGGLYLPRNWPVRAGRPKGGYRVVSLAWPYRKVRARLREAEALAGRPILGYGDLTVGAVARVTGLSREAARRAKAREYDETLILCPEGVEAVFKALEAVGLEWTHGGRFYHAAKGADKGRAVARLRALWPDPEEARFAVGLGDSLNDLPLFRAVNLAVYVGRGAPPEGVLATPAPGPEGFRYAVERYLLPRLSRRGGSGP